MMSVEALGLPGGPAAQVRRSVTQLARRLRAERSEDSLSSGKLSLLGHLVRRGPLAPSQLAAAEFVQLQSLTRLLAELEEAGLVDRAADPDDRRRTVVAVTAAGRAMLTKDMEGRDQWLARAMGELTQAERDVLRIAATLMERMADGR
jgi:DNA-binding MarR family transcriptional regulator